MTRCKKIVDILITCVEPALLMQTKANPNALRWDFFYRTETNHRSWEEQMKRPSIEYSASFPAGTTLAAALTYMHANGVPRGSARGGIFEVQAPEGIYRHKNEKRIDLSTPRKAANVEFKTWEQLEAEEQ